ncbi:MAG: phosphomannomutase/phosphoglucomutase [Patescibacteria group bacterium]
MQVDSSIFKTYDIRGVVGDNLSTEIMRAIGQAYATYLKPKRVVTGRDVRVSGPELQAALIDGIRSLGVAVVDIGVVTTDALYFAVGKYGYDGGAMVTASHNPPQWNGVKFTREQAIPLFGDQGIKQIGDIVAADGFAKQAARPGTLTNFDIQPAYVEQVLSFGTFMSARKLKVVIDPGNGTVSRFLPDVMARLPFAWSAINMEPDGTFPGRNPNPLAPGALDGLKSAVLSAKADVGVAFDADADRMFFTDEHGQRVLGDAMTALLAKHFLKLYPGSAIVYNLICSHMVPEEITKAGGQPIRSAVGHAYMKPAMRQHDAPFGGEISGHFFFRDHYYADSGLDAMVAGLDFLSGQDKPLSELVRAIDIYAHDAEVNSKVDDISGTIAKIKAVYATGAPDETDGLTVEYPTWWFNVRPSNTEPLLRLTVEAKTKEEMVARREELLKLIRE